MRRHVLVGRFGDDDTTPVPAAADEVMAALYLTRGKLLDFGIGRALVDLKRLTLTPTELAIDVLVLAAHVHAADTRLARGTESQDGWTREIRLVIPVSDRGRWASTAPVLTRMLNFLTGDRWTVGFRQRPESYAVLTPTRDPELLPAPFDAVGLFSGGLDSLIGAIDTLQGKGKPLLVSHAGEGLVSKSQDDCYQGLKDAFADAKFDRLRVWMNFEDGLFDGVASEGTTRGRSFLFIALGIAAGMSLRGPFLLKVPENGLIALNVPLDPLRLGALSTRTTHPFYLARWNELLGALKVAGSVENPYWDKTKGEMVSGCLRPDVLKTIAPRSLSCSSPSKARWQGKPQGHCGFCLPCLIRRASLGSQDETPYTLQDLHHHVLDTTQAEGVQVRSFQIAIERVKSRPELANLLIHKPGPLTDHPSRLGALGGVYARGLMEMDSLLKDVRTAPS